jgi:hypothetical protein
MSPLSACFYYRRLFERRQRNKGVCLHRLKFLACLLVNGFSHFLIAAWFNRQKHYRQVRKEDWAQLPAK